MTIGYLQEQVVRMISAMQHHNYIVTDGKNQDQVSWRRNQTMTCWHSALSRCDNDVGPAHSTRQQYPRVVRERYAPLCLEDVSL